MALQGTWTSFRNAEGQEIQVSTIRRRSKNPEGEINIAVNRGRMARGASSNVTEAEAEQVMNVLADLLGYERPKKAHIQKIERKF